MRYRRFFVSTLKWGCTAATVVIAVCWIASAWYAVSWWSPSRHEYLCLNIRGACLDCIASRPMPGESHFEVSRLTAVRDGVGLAGASFLGPLAAKRLQRYRKTAWLDIPLWWILLPTAVPAALLWRSEIRRSRRLNRRPRRRHSVPPAATTAAASWGLPTPRAPSAARSQAKSPLRPLLRTTPLTPRSPFSSARSSTRHWSAKRRPVAPIPSSPLHLFPSSSVLSVCSVFQFLFFVTRAALE